jgi:hypothetical protein
MTKLLQLLSVALLAATVCAEEENKEAVTTEVKAEVTDAAKKTEAMPAAHVEHVNRTAANAFTADLNAMTAPYSGPMTTIPNKSACCAEKKPPMAAHHGHAAAKHHAVAAKHDAKKEHHDVKHDEKKEDHDAAKKDEHKKAEHKDVKHDEKKEHHDEAKKDDAHKDADKK